MSEEPTVAKVRCIVKPHKAPGHHTVWDVYDTHRSSYPDAISGLGPVAQHHKSEKTAEAEAERVNEFYGPGPWERVIA